jgi:acylphosphatase
VTHHDASGEAPACRLVRAHGQVQGVGFRYACVLQARALGLTGWVRNRFDGTVEALLQGPAVHVEMMCEWMCDGDDNPARVDSLETQTIEPPHAVYERFEQAATA